MVHKFTLPNGLTVLLEPIDNVVSVSCGLWIKVGSRHEKANEMGYAHFIEHMLFKGTDKYSAKDIARLVDRVGGQHNAATNREYTCYYINVVSDYLELAVEILSDTYLHSTFDEEEIEKEKNVVIEEIRMYEDTPDEHIHDLFMDTMFYNSPLGHSILGSFNTISSINRESIVSFYKHHYTDNESLFVISGNFNIEEARQIIEKYFCKDCTATNNISIPSLPKYERKLRVHLDKDLEQVHLCIGTDGLSKVDEDRWAYYLFNTILGGSMSSRLFQNIREKEGLCYSIYCFHSSFMDTGVFGIYCGTAPSQYNKLLQLIANECRLITSQGISEEELADAKSYLIGNMALSLESTEVRMSHIAKNEIVFGQQFTFKEIVRNIQAVTMEDFRRITHRILDNAQFSLVTIGKLPQNPINEFHLGI
ncbi:MAG TPA: pitrilysin family protein [Spirochaetota bacterium]|nr:pitrilysin family protein [Spirochaetota bacterium]HOM08561.1 pitrilysin family protein [Spirochaetota bacterium]HPP48380.1 pitrilysin family protein [Spirochaetota bacterium]